MPNLALNRPAFVQTAEAFCAHIERADSVDRALFLRICFHLISKLLAEALDLPEVDGELNTPAVTRDQYNCVVLLLKAQLGQDDYYNMVFDPYETGAEPLIGSISDDLADIWRDLSTGLAALRDRSIEDAIEEWRFSFAYHWGLRHATHVLNPLVVLLLRDGWYERD